MLQVASQENGHVSLLTVLGNDLVRLLACRSFFFPVETGFVEVTRDEIPDGIYLLCVYIFQVEKEMRITLPSCGCLVLNK